MAVKIRMKKLGRTHRPYFRVCAMDTHTPRDGRAIEELGTYDPMVADTDARAILKADRIDYWLSVGAQPSQSCATLIKKYGTNGTHLEQQKAALDRLKKQRTRVVPEAPVKSAAKAEKPKADESKPADTPPADESAQPAAEAAAPAEETASPEAAPEAKSDAESES